MNNIILIPAYEASDALLVLVNESMQFFNTIIVVNDGSKLETSKKIFLELQQNSAIIFLSHPSNLGKGAALKTGLSYAIKNLDFDYIITVDADGQHLSNDVARISKYTQDHNDINLLLGVRSFKSIVPLRSKIGNILTSLIFKFVYGRDIPDTQTGLRAIKNNIIPDIIKINSNGYDFETDILIYMVKNKLEISMLGIDTVYLNNNNTSHFKPISDSIQIYRSILAFSVISFLCFFIDLFLFLVFFVISNSILMSVVLSRSISGLINFNFNKKKFLLGNSSNIRHLLLYFLFFSVNLCLSYLGIYVMFKLGFSILYSKITIDFILFGASFFIHRKFFFLQKY